MPLVAMKSKRIFLEYCHNQGHKVDMHAKYMKSLSLLIQKVFFPKTVSMTDRQPGQKLDARIFHSGGTTRGPKGHISCT